MSNHRYIVANYTLHSLEGGVETLVEATTKERPFAFISGLDMVLDALEEALIPLRCGETFSITLPPNLAFGERSDDRKHTLDKSLFYHDGEFDAKNIYDGATIKLNDGRGNSYDATVTEVGSDTVTVEIDADLNHPLAGKTLRFDGTILENREATAEEVQRLRDITAGKCSCGGCGGGCSDNSCGGCGSCSGDCGK